MRAIADENQHASISKCAFCKHWYDPTNSVIDLKFAKIWEYDPMVRKQCRIKSTMTIAQGTCSKFDSKI